MARINIEECWWSDPRRSKLIRLLGGDEERADGAAIKMWRTAQEFWKRDHQLIPRRVFEALQCASELIEAGLADDRSEFIYVRGSSEYLEWVKDKTEAGKLGGLKSAQARREKYGSAQPKPRSELEATPKQLEAPEPSGSVSGSGSKNREREEKKSLNPNEIQEAIEEWRKTLSHHKIDKDPRFDELEIARLILREGLEKTKLALFGAAFEDKSPTYEPSKHVSIRRLFKPEIFEKFVNLGAQNKPTTREFHEDAATC